MEIWVPPEARLEEEQILTAETPVCYDRPERLEVSNTLNVPPLLYMPLTQKLYLSLPEPSLEDNVADLDRIYREIRKKVQVPYLETPLTCLRGLARLLREDRWQITATLDPYDEHCAEILFLEPGNTCARNYGIGNSSLTGARMALLSRHALARATTLARQMTYFELSVDASFYDEFVAALFLPHTNITFCLR